MSCAIDSSWEADLPASNTSPFFRVKEFRSESIRDFARSTSDSGLNSQLEHASAIYLVLLPHAMHIDFKSQHPPLKTRVGNGRKASVPAVESITRRLAGFGQKRTPSKYHHNSESQCWGNLKCHHDLPNQKRATHQIVNSHPG